MRIPASLVVMGCVTAVPFGLAIRDTVRHTPRGDELDLTGEQVRKHEAMARERAEDAQHLAERLAQQDERDAMIDTIYGKSVASAGTVNESTPKIQLSYGYNDETVTVSPSICDRLHERLIAAWGPDSDGLWINPDTHQRAAFSSDECTLVFEPFENPQDWVTDLPLDLIGMKRAAFESKALVDPGEVEWRWTGVGTGRGVTHLSAQLEHDKVVGINVVGEADLATQQQIRDALTARLKVEVAQDPGDPNVSTWKSTPAVRFDASGASRFSLQIGKPSWQ